MNKITKAIIPAAGLGTRLLPQTKAIPKEMLPIIDKPVIQLVVEELVEAGITDIIIVTGPQKRAIEDHFDRSLDLEVSLKNKGKLAEMEQIKNIAEMANFVYLRQKGLPKGNARPIMNASHLLQEDEPFFVFFPDDYFSSEGKSSCRQMIEAYEKHQCPVLALTEVADEDLEKYGVIAPGEKIGDSTYVVDGIVEKPAKGDAPSNLASVSQYILTADFIKNIEAFEDAGADEVGVADVMTDYAKNHKVVGEYIEGKYLDCGSKQGYFEAILHAAKKDGLRGV